MTRSCIPAALYQDGKASRDEYVADGISYRIAQPGDNSVIKSILQQTPMKSWVTLSTDFSPDYFAAKNIFGNKETLLALTSAATQDQVGMCAYTTMQVYINGAAVTAGYLGELRVLPLFRHRLRILRNGFAAVKNHSNHQGGLSYWFTSVAKENLDARRLLEANIKGMPRYQPQGELATLALPTRAGQCAVDVMPAQECDIAALAQFYNNQARHLQYAPVVTETWLSRLDGSNGLRLQDFYLLKDGGSIRACFALWDQRQYKQTVVRGYRFPINILRLPYNLFATISERVPLPPVGASLDYIFIAFLAVDAQAREVADKLIKTALALIYTRQANLGMLGLAVNNPLLPKLRSLQRKSYYTCIEAVSWPDPATVATGVPQPAIQIVQPEIAVL